jgi:hypothetical protein
MQHGIEAAVERQAQGRELAGILAQAIEPENWREPDLLPRELVPLIKKSRREVGAEFPEIWRMPWAR